MRDVHPGAIILLHNGLDKTVEVLPGLLAALLLYVTGAPLGQSALTIFVTANLAHEALKSLLASERQKQRGCRRRSEGRRRRLPRSPTCAQPLRNGSSL
jgi:hypothetical protein